jgi:hypothetical protein
VNKLEITTDKRLLAAAGNPQIRLYEVTSNNNQPVLTYDGHTTNVTAVRACNMRYGMFGLACQLAHTRACLHRI